MWYLPFAAFVHAAAASWNDRPGCGAVYQLTVTVPERPTPEASAALAGAANAASIITISGTPNAQRAPRMDAVYPAVISLKRDGYPQ
jgi:hypothetical protein